jgi:hypothetical protein
VPCSKYGEILADGDPTNEDFFEFSNVLGLLKPEDYKVKRIATNMKTGEDFVLLTEEEEKNKFQTRIVTL